MTIRRRDMFKAGALGIAGFAGAALPGCGGGGTTSSAPPPTASTAPPAASAAPAADETEAVNAIRADSIRFKVRGLVLLDFRSGEKTLYARMLDAEKHGMPKHSPRLTIHESIIDQDATSATSTGKDGVGTQTKWYWDLAGITLSILDDNLPGDGELEPSNPAGNKPVLGNWKSLKWIPKLNQLCGATSVKSDPTLFVCNIPLKHGKLQGEKPKGRVGELTKWTVKKVSDGSQVADQYYSDTALFTRKLQGRTPVITVVGGPNAGKIVLREGVGDIVLSNLDLGQAPPKPTDPITLGHFPLFFKVVDPSFETDWKPDPTVLPPCSGCEADPIFCPPSWGSF